MSHSTQSWVKIDPWANSLRAPMVEETRRVAELLGQLLDRNPKDVVRVDPIPSL